jgi:hypothetical protein
MEYCSFQNVSFVVKYILLLFTAKYEIQKGPILNFR